MAFSSVFEKLGRAVFESPFESKRLAQDAPELAEIRLAAIDAIKAKSHRVGAQIVFPYDLVRVRLTGIPAEQEQIFRSGFISRYFADELKASLSRNSCRFPKDLAVEFATTASLPLANESWIAVEVSMRDPQAAAPPKSSATAQTGTLTVVKGSANVAEIRLEKPRTNIGRTAEVYNNAGPSRRNDLAFVGGSKEDLSVSREHAHILRSGSEYRLFNDRSYRGDSNCGLWIVRDGLSFPVHHGARGSLLRPGDEIYLGAAVLRFSCEEQESKGSSPAAAGDQSANTAAPES